MPRLQPVPEDPLRQCQRLPTLEAVLKILAQSFQQDTGCFGLMHSVDFNRQYRINPGSDDDHVYPNECNGKRVMP